jgi:DNA-binding NtrC family response regulator
VNGGTIILESVIDLTDRIQTKLLRAMVSGEIFRVGSKVPVKINVRYISTSRESLEDAVNEGRFREDLFYRLNIVNVKMPSLDERNDDIKVLSEHFLNHGKDQDSTKMLTSKALEKLASYNWPGNIRELKNLMERTYILVEDRYIDSEHLPELTKEEVIEDAIVEEFIEMTLHDLEKKHILKTLDHLNGNKTRAAKSLGITVKTLYNKLHSYGLVHTNKE